MYCLAPSDCLSDHWFGQSKRVGLHWSMSEIRQSMYYTRTTLHHVETMITLAPLVSEEIIKNWKIRLFGLSSMSLDQPFLFDILKKTQGNSKLEKKS